MKKVFIASLVVASVLATNSFATSIGRAGGGGSSSHSSSSSHSAPSHPSPAPSVAPAPSRPGGIGGTQSSVGVRKSEVTAPVAQQVRPATPSSPTPTPNTVPHSSPSPSYGYTPAPAPVVVQGGGGFGSSFMGSLGGTIVGNALFGNHNNGGGTTVINNGTPGGSGTVTTQSAGTVMDSSSGAVMQTTTPVQPKKEYTVWSFIADLFGIVIVTAILLGIVWLFYTAFKAIRNYVNKERGVSTQPFNPTQQFWRIQRAFAEADVTELNVLLGPDIVDELTADLKSSTLSLHNVSHEVRLANNTEFSIWYKFNDKDANGFVTEVNQVWHYERFGSTWKLNGIENV